MIPGLCADHPSCGCAASFRYAVDGVGPFRGSIIRADLADALCDSIADRHRLPVVLRRLERTAKRLPLSEEDLCIPALVCPVDAPTEAIEPNIAKPLEDTGLDQPAPCLSPPKLRHYCCVIGEGVGWLESGGVDWISLLLFRHDREDLMTRP